MKRAYLWSWLLLGACAAHPRPGPDGRFLRLGIGAIYAHSAVRGDGGGGGETYELLLVTVFNDSPTAVAARLACRVGEMWLAADVPPVDWAGERRVELIAPPGTTEDDLPLGRQRVRCAVRPADSGSPPELQPRDDVVDAELEVALPAYPDLGFDDASPPRVRDCARGAEPVATAPVCVHVAWRNAGPGTYAAAIAIRCSSGGEAAEVVDDGEAPQPGQRRTATLRFARLAAGPRAIRCAVDAANAMRERDETDNATELVATVLPDEAAWAYGAAIERVGRRVRELHLPQGDYPQPQRYELEVEVRNRGRFAIDGARVTCTAGALTLAGGWLAPQAPPLEPGAVRTVAATGSGAPPGDDVRCAVELLAPSPLGT